MEAKDFLNALCIAFLAIAFGTNIYIAASNYGYGTSTGLMAQSTSNGSSGSNGSSNSNGTSSTNSTSGTNGNGAQGSSTDGTGKLECDGGATILCKHALHENTETIEQTADRNGAVTIDGHEYFGYKRGKTIKFSVTHLKCEKDDNNNCRISDQGYKNIKVID